MVDKSIAQWWFSKSYFAPIPPQCLFNIIMRWIKFPRFHDCIRFGPNSMGNKYSCRFMSANKNQHKILSIANNERCNGWKSERKSTGNVQYEKLIVYDFEFILNTARPGAKHRRLATLPHSHYWKIHQKMFELSVVASATCYWMCAKWKWKCEW